LDVKGDDNFGFQVVAQHMDMHEEIHPMIRKSLILESKNHKIDYL